jgi:putative glutamine amidotransferase
MRPLLAVTMRVCALPSGEVHDALAQGWARFLDAALPQTPWLPVPNLGGQAIATLEACGAGALLLTGGDDWGVFPDRDATEAALLAWALQRHLPVAGVCRGAQVINQQLGGSLTMTDGTDHVATRHRLDLRGADVSVNSYHRQVIAKADLAPSLAGLAMAADGTVEAFGLPERRLLGLLWHPERENTPQSHDIALFRRLFHGEAQ